MFKLPFQPNENLLSSWDAAVCGAVAESSRGNIVCNITVANDSTRVAVCRHGIVVDTAVFELGPRTVECDEQCRIISISESGETFLDALAKQIGVGDVVEDHVPAMLGNLIGETVINLLVRRRPPQISMRMLQGEPFVAFYPITSFVVSTCADDGMMTRFVVNGIRESLSERELSWRGADCLQDECLISGLNKQYVTPTALIPQLEMQPVILFEPGTDGTAIRPGTFDRPTAIDERLRRYSLPRNAPYAVLHADRLYWVDGARATELASLQPTSHTTADRFITSIEDGKLEISEFKFGGITYGVTP